jgi:hypothetical protein
MTTTRDERERHRLNHLIVQLSTVFVAASVGRMLDVGTLALLAAPP